MSCLVFFTFITFVLLLPNGCSLFLSVTLVTEINEILQQISRQRLSERDEIWQIDREDREGIVVAKIGEVSSLAQGVPLCR